MAGYVQLSFTEFLTMSFRDKPPHPAGPHRVGQTIKGAYNRRVVFHAGEVSEIASDLIGVTQPPRELVEHRGNPPYFAFGEGEVALRHALKQIFSQVYRV